MSDWRQLGTVPENYFPRLHQMMVETGLGSLEFETITPAQDLYNVLALGPYRSDSVSNPEYGLSERDGMFIREDIEHDRFDVMLPIIAQTALQLHQTVMERSVFAGHFPYIRGAVIVDNIFAPPVKTKIGWHTDGSPKDRDFKVVVACDNLGTLRRSRFTARPVHMPTNTLIEFDADFEHAEPVTKSKDPINRTFVRLTYCRQQSKKLVY